MFKSTILGIAIASMFASPSPAVAPVNQNPTQEAPYAIVEHFESGYQENDWTILEVNLDGATYSVDVETERFNIPPTRDEKLEVVSILMESTGPLAENLNGETLYHFRTFDNSIHWLLSEHELGFVPEQESIHQVVYYENSTPGAEDEQREDDILLMVF